MLRSRSIYRYLPAVVCFVALTPAFAAAPHPVVDPRHVDGSSLGNALDLSSTWLMQAGDDPRYADPKFDDSQWKVMKAATKLSSLGLNNVNWVWYRTHVKVRLGVTDLSLLVRSFGGSYQVFVNGVEVGSYGQGVPGGVGQANFDQRYAIPAAATNSGDLTIAVRGAVARASEYGAGEGGMASYTSVLLGPTALLTEKTWLYTFRSYTSNTLSILMELLVPLIALALALTLPKEREYSALMLSGSAGVVIDIISVWRNVHNSPPSALWEFLSSLLGAIAIIALLEFVRLVLGLKRSRLWAGYEWLIGVLLVTVVPWVNYFFHAGATGRNGSFLVVVLLTAQVITLPFSAGLPLLALWVWWRKRTTDALLLFVPLFLLAAVQYCQIGLFLLNRFHLSQRAGLPVVPTDMFFLQWSEVANFLFGVALLLFLVLRTVRIARSRAAMATDLHAVQSVQEILLARASHPTPGFRVEHVYHPASEVGGDFFLVSPGPDGSLTAVVGDVSGKGLVAAMRVSMILGVLRREEQRDPSTIMRNLNDALMMQGEMGFTTACCVKLERDGHYTVANAGHISPYIGGEEILTPASLPLGLEADGEYEQISGYLPAGKTLVLMSDGVVEARSAKGELYGFERLPQLTMLSAVDIADVARRFGQEDDITVLTVAWG
jgi:hypothetical protein